LTYVKKKENFSGRSPINSGNNKDIPTYPGQGVNTTVEGTIWVSARRKV